MSAHHAVIGTSIGPLTLVSTPRGLAGAYFPGHWTRPDASAWGPQVEPDTDPVLTAAADQLGDYLAGNRRTFDLPLDLVGTKTARRVWDLLLGMPFGETTTYGAIAEQVTGTHARAVGHFVGHNPVSIVVPCHRVVGSDGSLTGYAGGIDRKRHLLTLEGVLQPSLW